MVWASSWLGIEVRSFPQALMLGKACSVIPVLIPLYLNLFVFFSPSTGILQGARRASLAVRSLLANLWTR